MKKVLFATSCLVAFAGAAAAEVAVSGDGRMGMVYDGDDMQFSSRARAKFTMTGESDSGLAFGAAFRVDQENYSANPEGRSAEWAEHALAGRLPAATVAEIARLVRSTADHRPADDDLPGQLLSDADLAILAAPAQRYRDYVAAVREEYAAVTDPDFRAGRAAILRDLLAKPALFHTEVARARWEDRARANVVAELAELAG